MQTETADVPEHEHIALIAAAAAQQALMGAMLDVLAFRARLSTADLQQLFAAAEETLRLVPDVEIRDEAIGIIDRLSVRRVPPDAQA